jgi:hypothetical protein
VVEIGLYRDHGEDRRNRRLPRVQEVAAAIQVEGDRDLAVPGLGSDEQMGVSVPAAAMVWHRQVDFELLGGSGDRIGALLAFPVLPGHDPGCRSALLREKALEMDFPFRVRRGIKPGFDFRAETRIPERECQPAGEPLQLAGVRGDVGRRGDGGLRGCGGR